MKRKTDIYHRWVAFLGSVPAVSHSCTIPEPSAIAHSQTNCREYYFFRECGEWGPRAFTVRIDFRVRFAASERRGRVCGVGRSERREEEEEPAASESLKVEGLKVVEKRKIRCGRSFSATFDFKTLRHSDAAGSSNISDSSAAAGVES